MEADPGTEKVDLQDVTFQEVKNQYHQCQALVNYRLVTISKCVRSGVRGNQHGSLGHLVYTLDLQ